MQKHLSQILSLLGSACFAAFAATAVAAPAAASHQQLSNGSSHEMPTKEYCKQHPTDPRCKK